MGGLWDYIKTLFGQKVEEMKDPEVEIEQAINAARERDRDLRNQAAKVIAHRSQIAGELEDSAEELAKAKELAKQALLKAEAAKSAGNADEQVRWTKSAQALAMRMQAAQSNYDRYKEQLTVADEQAEKAKAAVQQNAMELEEIGSKRLEMLGQLESAKMQEAMNEAMASVSASVGQDAPSLAEVEDKIDARMAEARAKAELEAVTPEGSMAELERAVDLAEADATLESLRAELGLAEGQGELPAGSSSSQLPPGGTTGSTS
jgi:phage shock protein A